MIWLKQNWFKVGILIILASFALVYYPSNKDDSAGISSEIEPQNLKDGQCVIHSSQFKIHI